MKRVIVAMVAVVALLGACGGDDSDESSSTDGVAETGAGSAGDGDASSGNDSSSGDGSTNEVIDAAPPGQATASVDGLDLTFELPGALACSIADDAITFSYRIGDNDVTLGAGANRVDGGWMGSIALNVADPVNEVGPIAYYPTPGSNGILDESLFAIDGSSMSYSGPMLKQPANDGSTPPPVDVGTGTISATCE